MDYDTMMKVDFVPNDQDRDLHPNFSFLVTIGIMNKAWFYGHIHLGVIVQLRLHFCRSRQLLCYVMILLCWMSAS